MDEHRELPDWENLYKETEVTTMPWYSEELDADLVEVLEERKLKKGTFLDLGTGPGTQAIQLVKRGFEVTATDISSTAIAKAKQISKDVAFMQDDILHSTLHEHFDFIFDRGCFHTLHPEQRQTYVDRVKNFLHKGGLLFLKCFDVKEPNQEGPYRFTQEDIKRIFGEVFDIESVKETVFHGVGVTPKALFIVMRRKE